MWHQTTETPESGKRIIATYNDGSGAALFLVHDHGLMDNEGHDSDKLGKEFDRWAYLPDDFRCWIEDNLED